MEQREVTMVRELCNLEDGLTEKEAGFVEDLARRNKEGRYSLSERQLEWLEALWDRECLKKGR